MKEYSKIKEIDVVNVILRTAHSWQGVGVVSPSNIQYLLKTSRYQVDKHIKLLKEKGLVLYESVILPCEYECLPPYNGYKLSEKGEMVYKDMIKEIEQKECELIKKCFRQ